MIVAFMEGHPRAEFEIRLQEYKNAVKTVAEYQKAHTHFAETECPLYRPEWEGNVFKYCRSAVHPQGYGVNNFCTIDECTWHIKEAHDKVTEEQCPQCKGDCLIMSDYPYSEDCPTCKGKGIVYKRKESKQ